MNNLTNQYLLLFILVATNLFFAKDTVAQEVKFIKLSNNVYQHVSYKKVEPWGLVGASGLVVINGDDAFIIDTPWTNSETEELLQWIKARGLTVKGAVVTHFHEDASGGLSLLNKLKIKTYATPLTNEFLRLSQKQTASHEVSNHALELFEGVVNVYFPGAGHTKDNIVVWFAKDKILFGGCFIKSLQSKNLGNTEDAVISAWPNSIEKVLARYPDIQIVVPGHGKVGDVSLLKHTQALALQNINSENN